jgi:hypothetical protein
MAPIQPWLVPVEQLDDATSNSYNNQRTKLYNAAESGDWDEIWSILKSVQRKYGESWVNCFTSDEGWTLLHYAALEPQPVSTCEKLIQMGAWRTLTSSPILPFLCFSGWQSGCWCANMLSGSVKTISTENLGLPSNTMTPYEIAKAKRFGNLLDVLKPAFKINVPDSRIRSLESQFHELICEDMGWDNDGSRRLPDVGVLREGNGIGHFPVAPGVTKEVRHSWRQGMEWNEG